MTRPRVTRSVVFGLGMGGLISILPLPVNFLLIAVLGVFSVVSLIRSSSKANRMERLLEAGVATAVVVTAIYLPVKELDRSVGPMHYEAMPLHELTRALSRDWRVRVSLDRQVWSEEPITFSTSEPMSRRGVLEKLARETGGELHIGYCGTGATFLFGASPSFTSLRLAQPDAAGNSHPPSHAQ